MENEMTRDRVMVNKQVVDSVSWSSTAWRDASYDWSRDVVTLMLSKQRDTLLLNKFILCVKKSQKIVQKHNNIIII